jgi:adenylate kinase
MPRNISQAKQLESMGEKPDAVVMFNVPDEVIIERTSGRWLHRASGRTYHEKFAPPKVAGKDDLTGEPLTQRNDDKKEIVTKRLEVFHHEMGPVEEFYKQQHVYHSIDGNRKMDAVRSTLFGLLDPIAKKLKIF